MKFEKQRIGQSHSSNLKFPIPTTLLLGTIHVKIRDEQYIVSNSIAAV